MTINENNEYDDDATIETIENEDIIVIEDD